MESQGKQWYILKFSGSIKRLKQELESLSSLRMNCGKEPLEYFFPICVNMAQLFGKSSKHKYLLGNFMFTYGSYIDILEATQIVGCIHLLPHPVSIEGEGRWITISDSDMTVLKAIASVYANKLPCIPMNMVALEDGDKVEIAGGHFNGAKGTLQCHQGRNGGNVLIAIGDLFIVSTPTIQPQYIRILQFGRGNRHPYRQFEAHLTRAIHALEHLFAPSALGLTIEDVNLMSVFTDRYAALRPATVNTASQHATLMLMSYTALQDKVSVNRWLERCRMLLPQVKSLTQRAWQLTFMFASTGDATLYHEVQSIISSWVVTPNNRKRSLIVSTISSFSRLHSLSSLH